MKKIYIVVFISILSLITLSILSFNLYKHLSFSGTEVVYSLKTNYTYNVSNDNNIEVLIYSNNPKSVIKEYNKVDCTLKDDNTILSAEILSSNKVSSYRYDNEWFYSYKLIIAPIDVNLTFKMSKCTLETHDMKVDIGTLSVVDISSNSTSPLDFTKIYAVGNDTFGFKTINAFVISLKNKSNSDIVINKFYIGEYNNVNLSEAVVIDNDVSTSAKVSNYVKGYDEFDYSSNSGSVVIKANQTVKLLIPVYYKSKSLLHNTLIYINDQLYIDNFDFIKNYDDLDQYEGIINEATTNFS